jgi:Tfp pilus assembly pilus retraction ATPase PilT
LSLERLLQQAAKAGGTEVRLVPGRRIALMTPAGEREVQGPPLTPQTVDQYLGPVLTDDARHSLISGHATWTFTVDGLGPIRGLVEQGTGGLEASFQIGGGGGPAAVSAAVPAGASAGAAPAPPPASAARRKHTGPTADMDELFSVLAEMKASDLHLSVGSPPMVRHDGEMKLLPGRPVLTPADTERMMFAIAPERNKVEFAKRNDTDFAYELEGVGRFRCNFFRDRKGVGGVYRIIPSKIMTAEDMNLSKEIF